MTEKNKPQENSEVEQNKMKKSIVELTAMNKALLLEQIYHLSNIEANNLLIYHDKVQ
jgi:hypothetical protein